MPHLSPTAFRQQCCRDNAHREGDSLRRQPWWFLPPIEMSVPHIFGQNRQVTYCRRRSCDAAELRTMLDATARRVATTAGHFASTPVSPPSALHASPTAGALHTQAHVTAELPLYGPDVAAITRLLDHDNHAMRDAMKELMKADLFAPVRGAAVALRRLVPRARSPVASPPPAVQHAAARGARAGAGAAGDHLRAAAVQRASRGARDGAGAREECAPQRRGAATAACGGRAALWRSEQKNLVQLNRGRTVSSRAEPLLTPSYRCETFCPTTRTASSRRTRWPASATARSRRKARALALSRPTPALSDGASARPQ